MYAFECHGLNIIHLHGPIKIPWYQQLLFVEWKNKWAKWTNCQEGFPSRGKRKVQESRWRVNFTMLFKVRSVYFLLSRANRRNNTCQAAAAKCLPYLLHLGPHPFPVGYALVVFPFSTWTNKFRNIKWRGQDLRELGLLSEPTYFVFQYSVSLAQHNIRCAQSRLGSPASDELC